MGIFQQKYITEATDNRSPQHTLWISVLSKAAHDAIYGSDWTEAKLAISWFKGMGMGFRDVCSYAGKDPKYVYQRMEKPIADREAHMEMVRNGQRLYVKDTVQPETRHRSHYRGAGPRKRGSYKKKKKHLMGNSYYKAKREKNLRMVLQGRKGGRPRMYDGI